MAAEGPLATGHALESDARALLENPPDGVDLDALGAGAGQLLPPEECERLYQDAFEAAGGQAALEASKELSAALGAELAAGTSGPAQQLKVWQAYDLSTMMRRLGDGSAVRKHGERRLAGLSQELQRAVHREVELNIAGVKKWGRASVKVRIKYASDCSQLCDLNRAELVCPSVEVMYAAARHLFELWGPRAARHDTRLVEWEDRYQVPMPGGYRHLQVLAAIGGSIWELQLNTAPMLEAKHRAGHKLYKTTRFVKEMILLTGMEGDGAVLRDLLAKPGVQAVANPNEARDKNGLTALHHVAFRGDEDLLEVLLAGEGLAAAADPWATDRSDYGGLPLSYALQMRSHRLALALVRRMAPPPPDLSSAARSRLAEAAAAVIDAHEEALEGRHWEQRGSSCLTSSSLEAFEEVSQVTEELLRMLAGLWQAVAPDDTWKGMDPLAYAFHTEATSSLRILVECANLWAVDDQGRLPIERAAHLGFWDLLDRAASLMASTQPLQVSADAAWSLARCRATNVPQDLLGELQAHDRRLQRRIYTCGPAKQLDISVSHSGEGTVLRQSDALELKGLKEVTPESAYRCMVLEDDTLYAGTADGYIDKWDVKTMELVGNWQAHSQRVSCLLLGSKRPYFDGSQRARKLFSGSFDNTVRIWDLWKPKGHCIGVLKHTEDVRALSRYGSVLFAAQGPRIALWDIAKVGNMRRCGELRGHPGLVDVLTLTGGLLLSGGQGSDIRVWTKAETAIDQWCELACWKGHSENFRVRRIASDGAGRVFSAAHGDAGAQPWGPGAWSHTQKDAKAELCFWTREGTLLAKQHSSSPITGIQCLEGVLFSADLGGHVRLWNAATCEEFAAFPAHGGPIRAFLICNGDSNPMDSLEAVEESEEESMEQVRSRPTTSRAQSSEPGTRTLSAASQRSKAEQGRPVESGGGAVARPESVTSTGTRGSAGGRSEASSLPRLQPPRLPFFRTGAERSVQRVTRSSSRSRASSSRVGSSMSPHSRSPASSVSTTDGASWPLTPMRRGKAAAEVSHRMLLPPRQPLDGSYQPAS